MGDQKTQEGATLPGPVCSFFSPSFSFFLLLPVLFFSFIAVLLLCMDLLDFYLGSPSLFESVPGGFIT